MTPVQVSGWSRYSWLRHGFSTRVGGVSTIYGGRSLNLGRTKEDDPALVTENRQRLLEGVLQPTSLKGVQPTALLRQTHSTTIHVLQGQEDAARASEGDGLITHQTGLPLGILTADCVPVMIVDPVQRVVGVFHAGWRGTAAAIVEEGVARMTQAFRSRPEELIAAVGPSIGPCCYAVGDEVRSAFTDRFPYADQLFSHERLNLWEANRRQLLEAGVLDSHITVIGECTGCAVESSGERRYFSHRIDHGVTGRMMSIVCIV